MSDVTQTEVLLAINSRSELFKMFDDMFTSSNYTRVLMAYDEGDQYSDIAEKASVSDGTISNAFKELEEYGLIENRENGRQHTLPVLNHPMVQYYYWNEVIEDGE